MKLAPFFKINTMKLICFSALLISFSCVPPETEKDKDLEEETDLESISLDENKKTNKAPSPAAPSPRKTTQAASQVKQNIIDLNFGEGGIGQFPFNPIIQIRGLLSNAYKYKILPLEDERTLFVGQVPNGLALFRFLPNGKIDKSFGNNGFVSLKSQFKMTDVNLLEGKFPYVIGVGDNRTKVLNFASKGRNIFLPSSTKVHGQPLNDKGQVSSDRSSFEHNFLYNNIEELEENFENIVRNNLQRSLNAGRDEVIQVLPSRDGLMILGKTYSSRFFALSKDVPQVLPFVIKINKEGKLVEQNLLSDLSSQGQHEIIKPFHLIKAAGSYYLATSHNVNREHKLKISRLNSDLSLDQDFNQEYLLSSQGPGLSPYDIKLSHSDNALHIALIGRHPSGGHELYTSKLDNQGIHEFKRAELPRGRRYLVKPGFKGRFHVLNQYLSAGSDFYYTKINSDGAKVATKTSPLNQPFFQFTNRNAIIFDMMIHKGLPSFGLTWTTPNRERDFALLRVFETPNERKARLEEFNQFELKEKQLEEKEIREDEVKRLALLEAEQREQERLAKLEAEKKAKEEAERKEKERLAKLEAEKKAKEEAERLEQERLAKLEAERKEKERLAKLETERKEQERLAKIAAEKKAKEEAERKEKERLAKIAAEKKAKEEAERKEKERLAKIAAEKKAKEEAERKEKERLAKIEAEKKEKARLAKLEAERLEKARLAKLEAERLEKERLAKIEAERLEKERLAKIAKSKATAKFYEVITKNGDEGMVNINHDTHSWKSISHNKYASYLDKSGNRKFLRMSIKKTGGAYSHLRIHRFDHKGKVDNTFGSNGLKETSFSSLGLTYNSLFNGIQHQKDGKFLVYGTLWRTSSIKKTVNIGPVPMETCRQTNAPIKERIWSHKSYGKITKTYSCPDPFRKGRYVAVLVSSVGTWRYYFDLTKAEADRYDSDRIGAGQAGPLITDFVTTRYMGVIRFNADGSLDKTFGDNGISLQNMYENIDTNVQTKLTRFAGTELHKVAPTQDGGFMLLGQFAFKTKTLTSRYTAGYHKFGAIKLDKNGKRDANFGVNGYFDLKMSDAIDNFLDGPKPSFAESNTWNDLSKGSRRSRRVSESATALHETDDAYYIGGIVGNYKLSYNFPDPSIKFGVHYVKDFSSQWGVLKINKQGLLDLSFGDNGKKVFEVDKRQNTSTPFILSANQDKLLLVGKDNGSSRVSYFSGAISGNNFERAPFPYSSRSKYFKDKQGKILEVKENSGKLALKYILKRYHVDGSVDKSFADGKPLDIELAKSQNPPYSPVNSHRHNKAPPHYVGTYDLDSGSFIFPYFTTYYGAARNQITYSDGFFEISPKKK